MSESFLAVTRAIADFVATQDSADEHLGAAIRHMEKSSASAAPNPLYLPARPTPDYGDILAMALTAAAGSPLAHVAKAIAPVSGLLPWHYSYPTEPGEENLADRIAFAEIVGPQGALIAPHARLGFTLMAPHTFYPMHAHPAVELYLVVAGHAAWLSPGIEEVVPPGGFVLHRTGQPHAMRTADEPLLAIYAWQGDLDTPSIYL
ncbi:dimethylsulfonioproprionate lyase family protein [Dongia sp.]|uniref:dimethylsulfonioproprionate lyase family protein n=1 Tax=Dongia sp. TaxID=1977262 RepID=UPI0035B4E54E